MNHLAVYLNLVELMKVSGPVQTSQAVPHTGALRQMIYLALPPFDDVSEKHDRHRKHEPAVRQSGYY